MTPPSSNPPNHRQPRHRQLRVARHRRHLRTSIASIVVLLASLLFAQVAATAQAAPARDTSMEAGFLSGLNQQRAARGVAPLRLSPSMSGAAAEWTTQMVSGSFLAHASDIKPGVPSGWSKIGENVGRGQSVTSLTQSFMASPGHARNVLDPDFTHVGIAVIVHPGERVYTTHRFAALATPAAPPAPDAPPAPPMPPVPPVVPTSTAVLPPAPPVTTTPPPTVPAAAAFRVTEVVAPDPPPPPRINAAAIPVWQDIDHVRAAVARKVATFRGLRQPASVT